MLKLLAYKVCFKFKFILINKLILNPKVYSKVKFCIV